MASDYASISAENGKRYGTEVSYYGSDFADRYTERTHFIFELLQNAEDALRLRREWEPDHQFPRRVSLRLSTNHVEVTHYGLPFSEDDVRAICSIKRGTKKLTDIGRFGIGFKSVYAYTRRPEVHSGCEHFAIESYVHPMATPVREAYEAQTLFHIPFDHEEISAEQARDEIGRRLPKLGFRTLLFLNEIESVDWAVVGGRSGSYIRECKQCVGYREVTLRGQLNDGKAVKSLDDQRWLIFSRPVRSPRGEPAGQVEIAFRLAGDSTSERAIVRANNSNLVVFFPTEKETHCGFLMQGPYKTTPSRDNVPCDDKWNRYLVEETAELVPEALLKLSILGMVSVGLLQAMPLLRSWEIPEDWMFRPVYDAVVEALREHPLIPAAKGRAVCGRDARFARGKGLVDLFGRKQLTALLRLGEGLEADWVSPEISESRADTSGLFAFLRDALDVGEIAPENLPRYLTEAFFQEQTYAWMARFYTFLLDHERLWSRVHRGGALLKQPFIRLEDDRHVPPFWPDGTSRVYLPVETQSDFDTVHRLLAKPRKCSDFLRRLGLTEPDVTTEVLLKIVPQYEADEIGISTERHLSNLRKIFRALSSDSPSRTHLLERLRQVTFLSARNPNSREEFYCRPESMYFPTKQLQAFFRNQDDVLFLAEPGKLVGSDKVEIILKELGVTDKPRRVPVDTDDSWKKRRELRQGNGHTRDVRYLDYDIHGLGDFLKSLRNQEFGKAARQARLLWDFLIAHIESFGHGTGASFFRGEYEWFYYTSYVKSFDAYFLTVLRTKKWLPGKDGKLHKPSELLPQEMVASLSRHPVLCEELQMKAEVLVNLAKEAGVKIEDLIFIRQNREEFENLKRNVKQRSSVTAVPLRSPTAPTAAETTSEPNEEQATPDDDSLTPEGALASLGIPSPEPPAPGNEPEPEYASGGGSGHGSGGNGGRGGAAAGGAGGNGISCDGRGAGGGGQGEGHGRGGGKGAGGGKQGRPFISYVGVRQEEEEQDPDGLEHQQRLDLEKKAIELILNHEPQLERTPTNNEGFDLTERGPSGETVRWIEVKAMTRDLQYRGATLSDAQFECAREHGEQFWFYIVENTGTPDARIVRIQDPYGKARTFTFDHGWLSAAEIAEADDIEEAEEMADGKD